MKRLAPVCLLLATISWISARADETPPIIELNAATDISLPVIIYSPSVSPVIHYLNPQVAISSKPPAEILAAVETDLKTGSGAPRFEIRDPAARHVIHMKVSTANPVLSAAMHHMQMHKEGM